MFVELLPYCRFHLLRFWRAQPRTFAMLAVIVLWLLIASLAYLQQWQLSNLATQELSSLLTNKLNANLVGRSNQSGGQAPSELPPFNSAQLVKKLNEVATDIKLPVDEISFTLEDNNQAYLRYRIKFSVVSTYPVIRHFVNQLRDVMPYVSLDNISCAREDIGIPELNCDLVFSAFYRQSRHG